jgi:hypothetical protein
LFAAPPTKPKAFIFFRLTAVYGLTQRDIIQTLSPCLRLEAMKLIGVFLIVRCTLAGWSTEQGLAAIKTAKMESRVEALEEIFRVSPTTAKRNLTLFLFGDSIMRHFASYFSDYLAELPCSEATVVYSCINSSLTLGEHDLKVRTGSTTIPGSKSPFGNSAQLRIFYQPLNRVLEGGFTEVQYEKLKLAIEHAGPVDWVLGQGLLHFFDPFDADATTKGITRDDQKTYVSQVETMMKLSKGAATKTNRVAQAFWMTTHTRNGLLIPLQYWKSQNNVGLAAWNKVAVEAAGRLGLSVVDVENVTLPFMNHTLDGTHFDGIVQEVMADRLLRALCSTSAAGETGRCLALSAKLHADTLSQRRVSMDQQAQFQYALKLEKRFQCFKPLPAAAFPWQLPVDEVARQFTEADQGGKGSLTLGEFKRALHRCDPYIPLNGAQYNKLYSDRGKGGGGKGGLNAMQFGRVYDRAWVYSRMAHAADASEDELSAAFAAGGSGSAHGSDSQLGRKKSGSINLVCIESCSTTGEFHSTFSAALVALFKRLPGYTDKFRKGPTQRVSGWANRIFGVFDADQDGKLDAAEWKGYFAGLREHHAIGSSNIR